MKEGFRLFPLAAAATGARHSPFFYHKRTIPRYKPLMRYAICASYF